MVWFWCRTKQAQLRALSNQLLRCHFQNHVSSSVTRGTKIGVVNGPSLNILRTGSEFGNRVRFFAAPAQDKPKYEEKDKDKRPRMNKEIVAPYVRLVTDEGHGVVEREVALARAAELEVDLVEVQPGNPPVCKLMDYNKEIYKKHVKEKEQTKKKKSELVLRQGGLKEVRITYKIDKHDMQTKADTIKRLAERGYRVKCMAVIVPNEDAEKQDLGGLLSRLSGLIEDFSIVESGPKVEAKQAYFVVRHIKFGPLKKGGKKNVSEMLNNISKRSHEEEQSLNESDTETVEDTYSETEMELDSADDFDQNHKIKTAPEMSNRYAAVKQTNGSENRYATARPTNGSGPGVRRRFESESQRQYQSHNPNNRRVDFIRRGPGEAASGYGMFDAPKPNNDPHRESRPAEVNRYQKGPRPQVPTSRGDFSRGNTNMNPGGIREKQAGFRR